MPNVIKSQKTPRLDMNPMTDLAFLLVTFFMLTTTFKTEEPLQVKLPYSQSQVKLPETDIMTISFGEEGRIFFGVDGKFTRERMLDLMGKHHGISFSPAQVQSFGLLNSMGVPVSNLPQLLDMPPAQRKEVAQPGIPIDSLNNELDDWIVFARIANPKIRVVLNGDQETPYPLVKRIMNMLVENNITRFNLITELEDRAS